MEKIIYIFIISVVLAQEPVFADESVPLRNQCCDLPKIDPEFSDKVMEAFKDCNAKLNKISRYHRTIDTRTVVKIVIDIQFQLTRQSFLLA